jgi:hypothetical protein
MPSPRSPAHRPRRAGALLLAGALVVLSGCGGGDGAATEDRAGGGTAAAAPDPATPVVLGQPRGTLFGHDLQLAWARGGFPDTVFARLEFGFGFAPGPGWTLALGGPPVKNPSAPFDFRYEGGFFVLTALADNAHGDDGLPHGVDVYPSDVEPVTPITACDDGVTSCYNGYGFAAWLEWPRRAGGTLSIAVAQPETPGWQAEVLLQPAAGAPYQRVAGGFTRTAGRFARVARALDFPTAQVKLRHCDPAGRCVESEPQPLLRGLQESVLRLDPQAEAGSPHTAISADGRTLALEFRGALGDQVRHGVWLHRRDESGRWAPAETVASSSAGFGRRFALSGDGRTLAVESSTCGTDTLLCEDARVHVFHLADGAWDWTEQQRVDGARAPQLDAAGDQLALLGTGPVHGGRPRMFARSGAVWQEQVFPPLAYVPRDLALSGEGGTLVLARRGHGNAERACGCRAVEVFRRGAAGWQPDGDLRAARGGPDDDAFGAGPAGSASLAVDHAGTRVVVGAAFDGHDADGRPGGPPRAGALHVFERDEAGRWTRRAFLKPQGAAADDRFGHQVVLSGDGRVIAAGARGLAADVPGVNRNHAVPVAAPASAADGVARGAAAYLFEADGAGGWRQRATAVPPGGARVGFERDFRLALSHDGERLAFGTVLPQPAAGPGTTARLSRGVFVY